MKEDSSDFNLPPPGPPPLLGNDQVRHLAYQGWLPIQLPAPLLADLQLIFQEGASFFNKPQSEKASRYPASRGTECGFYHVPEEKECVTFRHVNHDSDLARIASRIWQQSAQHLHRILCDVSRAGGFGLDIWDHLVEGALEMPLDSSSLEDVPTLMRLFRYYPHGGFAQEHVDIGLLTLCLGAGEGLQVLDWDTQQYVGVQGPIILVGDFARTLLRGRVRAAQHRVVSNPDGRGSLVFALRPTLKHPTDLARFGGSGIVDTKALYLKIKGAKFNVNATKDVREKDRQAQKARAEALASPKSYDAA